LFFLSEPYKKEIEEKVNFYSTDKKDRPLVISIEDQNIKGLKWAVPLTTKNHLSDKKKIKLKVWSIQIAL